MPAITTAAAVSYVNDGFEVTYDGWTNLGDQTQLDAVPQAAHDSQRGMLVTNRTTPQSGAYSEKGFYLEGGRSYDYSVWVKQDAAAADTFSLNLRYLSADGSEQNTVLLTSETAASGEWTQLTATYKAPADTVNLTLLLTSDSTADFCFDDVRVEGKEKQNATLASAADEVGLKDIYANYFRFGTCLPSNGINNSTLTALVLREFNSVTCENEMKPDATMVQSQSSGTNVAVSLSSAAGLLNFCVQNKIAVRGHTFVWHSQTPDWVFKEGFNNNGSWVSSSVMNQRMESYIKNMFAAIEKQYPTLNLYAYDVANECISDNGGPRTAGSNNQTSGNSAWVQVYGNNSFLDNAFTYARKYAPEGCSLFYNDYNEYMGTKMNDIYTLVSGLYKKGILDGVGMQSHLGASYPDVNTYKAALTKYNSIGCQIQVTELDIEDGGNQGTQYKQILQAILDTDKTGGNVTAVVVWGTTDDRSWRTGKNPLLFNSSFQKKDAYTQVASLIPANAYGDGDNPSGAVGGNGGGDIDPPEPDKNGYYFHSTFEEGTDDWGPRGSNSAQTVSGTSYLGQSALAVTDRTEAWNGAGYTLSSFTFLPGKTYSFSTMVMQKSGSSEDLNLTLQYDDASGETQYVQVATATAASGAWTKLENTSYTIPADAGNMLLYVETPENLIDFYMDEAIGAVEGTKNPGQTEGGEDPDTTGDINGDGKINATDVKALQSYLVRKSATIDATAADMDKNEVINALDLVLLKQKILSGETVVTTTTSKTTTTTTNKTNTGVNGQWNTQMDISWIDTSKPMVAFTFDDGPVGTAATDTSIRIQNALSQNNAHATFFYVGSWIGNKQEEIKRANSLGFEIGNHTYTHADLTGKSADQIKSEIQQTADLLTSITGKTSFPVRPPYLSVNSTVQQNAGVPLINCNVYSMDWEGASSDAIINTITTAKNNGSLKNSIVLMHETYANTATAIEYLAPYLKSEGWQIVSVSEMFQAQGKSLQAGGVYNSCN